MLGQVGRKFGLNIVRVGSDAAIWGHVTHLLSETCVPVKKWAMYVLYWHLYFLARVSGYSKQVFCCRPAVLRSREVATPMNMDAQKEAC